MPKGRMKQMDSRIYMKNLLNVKKWKENKALQGRLKVVSAKTEMLQGEPKLLLNFDLVDEGLIVNTTNNKIMSDKLGYETDGWIGAIISLEVAPATYNEELVEGLRIKTVEKK